MLGAPFFHRPRGSASRTAALGTVAVIGLLILSSTAVAGPSLIKPAVSKLAQFKSHISHIVFLMQENHAFDNLFGVYCPKLNWKCTSTADGIPGTTCVPFSPAAPKLGCVKPYNFTIPQLIPASDMAHDWNSTHKAYNSGAMNNFYSAEGSTNETFGHYNGTTVPNYWDLAEQYGLADEFFSSTASYSLPNHWYMVSPKAPTVSYVVKVQNHTSSIAQQHLYLNQSNATPSIEDRLINSTVSWKYYDYGLQNYAHSILRNPSGNAYDYWNPLAARAQSYAASVSTHFQPRSSFFSDAAAGTLPNVSWVIPTPATSDHPPADLKLGMNWVTSVVNAIEGSPQWNSTVLFISWDEYGGFYDHVAPPSLDAYGAGFRVPLLAIGPWVKQGFIDHDQMDFTSVLHLMEVRFGLTCLGVRDCNATLPMGLFNFNHTLPRTPIRFPDWANATYPMPLQSSGKLPPFGPFRSIPFGGATMSTAPLPEVLDWS